MRIYKEVPTTTQELQSVTCDRCASVYTSIWELQEFFHYSTSAGYGSILGDGNDLEMDLCQHCVKEILGQYIRVIGNVFYGAFEKEIPFQQVVEGCDTCNATGKV
jgi:hypothetical protein